MKRDGVTDKKIVQILPSKVRTADENADLDLAAHGYPGKVTIVFDFGIEGDALSGSVKMEGKLRHGDSATPTTAVVQTDVVLPPDQPTAIVPATVDSNGLVVIADGNADIPGAFRVGYVGSKRFVNVLLDATNLTNGIPCGVSAILEDLANTPT